MSPNDPNPNPVSLSLQSSWEAVSALFRQDGGSAISSITNGLLLTLAGISASVVVPIYASNLMGPSDYGAFAFVQSAITLIGILALLGIDGYAIRTIPALIEQKDGPSVWRIIFVGAIIGFAVSLLLALGLGLSSELLKSRTSLAQVLMLAPSVAITYFLSFCLQGVKASVIGAALRNPVVLAAFTIGGVKVLASIDRLNTKNLVWILTLSYAILAGIMFLLLKWKVAKLTADSKNNQLPLNERLSIRGILIISLPMLVFSSSFYLMSQTDIIIIGYMSNAIDVTTYSFASRVSMLASIGLLTANIFLPPLIARLGNRSGKIVLQQLFVVMNLFSIVIFCVISVIIFFAAPYFAKIADVAETDWWTCLIILLIGQFANVFTGSCGYLLTMTGNQNVAANATMAAAVANAVLNVILIPPLGIVGAALATSIALSSANVYMAWKAHLLTGLSPSFFRLR